MFQNARYITRGVDSEIPLWLQNFMWYAVDSMEIERDYLQVFKLSYEDGRQKIVHTREHPPYEHIYRIDTDSPVTAKIFVIDDEDHSTMLLAEEY